MREEVGIRALLASGGLLRLAPQYKERGGPNFLLAFYAGVKYNLPMCAINPKHEKHFTLSVYTSLDLPKEEFNYLVSEMAVKTELALNMDMRLRWHIKEKE